MPQDRLSKAGSKAELFITMAKRVAERGPDRRRGFRGDSLNRRFRSFAEIPTSENICPGNGYQSEV